MRPDPVPHAPPRAPAAQRHEHETGLACHRPQPTPSCSSTSPANTPGCSATGIGGACDPPRLRTRGVAPPRRGRLAAPAKRNAAARPAGTPVAEIPELVGAAAAGASFATRRFRGKPAVVSARCDAAPGDRANPGNLRIVRMRGDAMEPLLSEGDRIVIDTARRCPTTGEEICVLWDGSVLAIRRVKSCKERTRAVAAHDRQPELCTHQVPRRRDPHRRDGAVDVPAALTDSISPTRTMPGGLPKPVASPGPSHLDVDLGKL